MGHKNLPRANYLGNTDEKKSSGSGSISLSAQQNTDNPEKKKDFFENILSKSLGISSIISMVFYSTISLWIVGVPSAFFSGKSNGSSSENWRFGNLFGHFFIYLFGFFLITPSRTHLAISLKVRSVHQFLSNLFCNSSANVFEKYLIVAFQNSSWNVSAVSFRFLYNSKYLRRFSEFRSQFHFTISSRICSEIFLVFQSATPLGISSDCFLKLLWQNNSNPSRNLGNSFRIW